MKRTSLQLAQGVARAEARERNARIREALGLAISESCQVCKYGAQHEEPHTCFVRP